MSKKYHYIWVKRQGDLALVHLQEPKLGIEDPFVAMLCWEGFCKIAGIDKDHLIPGQKEYFLVNIKQTHEG
jgi:hypothetical protein